MVGYRAHGIESWRQGALSDSLLALFYNPSAEVEIEPARACEEGGAKYLSIAVTDYLQHYYAIAST